MKFTVEQLLTAIRGSDSLEALQRMVGPSDEQSKANVARLDQLDRYFDRFGPYGNDWPEHAKELMAEQTRFESTYC